MGKRDKKKGKGAEKTQLKTEKKALSKIKKQLAKKGEDDIEKLISEFQAQAKQVTLISEEQCPQLSPRSGFSFCSHPEKEELLVFGGEYFNGSKTAMYNDLYFYNIRKDQWSILQSPLKPPPRCSHQVVVVAQGGGQMWMFGGEFASPSRSNFYHYKDFWVFHFNTKKWEQVKAIGGPSARSGHRMVFARKHLIVFGGFHESIMEYKYFNDVHVFNMDTYKWSTVEPVGKGPSPRSGCQMAALSDGRILVYGGYTKERVKKDVDKGISHTDMFFLQFDERSTPPKWKWHQVKPTGNPPSPRSGFSITVSVNNRAYAFGGVHDEVDDDEVLKSVFYNDLFLLEMDKNRFLPISLHGKELSALRKKRKKMKEIGDPNDEIMDEESVASSMEQIDISDEITEKAEIKTYEDSVFTVKIGPQASANVAANDCLASTSKGKATKVFVPKPRMNASLTVKNGILYLYGGQYEEDDRRVTMTDFYSLDIHKLDEWKTIVPFSSDAAEWVESEDSESDEGSGEDSGSSEDDDASDDMDTL